MQQGGTTRPNPASVSAALAAANVAAQSAQDNPSFAGPAGPSLAEMAQRDLDAALQLLADRAQYITGAHGAAIALRRDGKKDMLCRASTGSNVPELGALLSTEFGLSGESVRTRQALRCDDTERDARVNREVCRQMGIASVVVMPVANDDDEVLGVFELFSGHVNAFGERDLSALQRLSEMVETAVRLAHASASFPEQLIKAPEPLVDPQDAQRASLETPLAQRVDLEVESGADVSREPVASPPVELPSVVTPTASEASQVAAQTQVPIVVPAAPVPEAKKPLFWSASLDLGADEQAPTETDQSHVPPVLRNLPKCQACGFPVSEGRVLCVECEEKKWRGQLRAKAPAKAEAHGEGVTAAPSRAFAAAQSAAAAAPSTLQKPALTTQVILASAKRVGAGEGQATAVKENTVVGQPKPALEASTSVILSAGLEPSQSWFSANKYILGALLVVAAVVTAILLLR